MVDPTKIIGSGQNIQQGRPSQAERGEERRAERKAEARAADERRDEVSLSREALDLARAQEASRDVRVRLEQNRDLTLGLDPSFDESA